MLRGRSSGRNRNANRSSRGRGQESTSRGASTSSITSSGPISPNPFEQERLENAAKRTQRDQNGTMVNGGGGRGARGLYTNKQVRFSDASTEQKSGPFSKAPSPTTTNPFAQDTMVKSSPFASPTLPAFNPFGARSKPETVANPFNNITSVHSPFAAPPNPEAVMNPFNNPSPISNTFGAPSKGDAVANPLNNSNTTSNPFGAASKPPATTTSSVFGVPSSNPWGKPSPGVFGTTPAPNPFAVDSSKIDSPVANSNTPVHSSLNPFGTPSSTTLTGFPTQPTSTFGFASKKSTTAFGSVKSGFGVPNGSGASNTPSINGVFSEQSPVSQSKSPFAFGSTVATPKSTFKSNISASSPPAAGSLGARVAQVLQKERIVPPQMPSYDLMYERQLLSVPEMMKYLNGYKDYQKKVRAALMKAGVIDDPDKPKALADAIDFKGTCEDMCPHLEKVERLMEGRVDICEKGVRPDGSLTRHAVMDKLVKIHARSSAGQDAPLPSEVRTTAALRRTVDYLMKDVLTEDNLSRVHGFLWNRTRAIRRDFVFHSYLTGPELLDQVYCLETIARFHTLALHLMSKKGNQSEAFDTYQEFEQLGNTMISLLQAYDDCKANGVICENEAEFRAYSVLIQRKTHPGLLDMVQNWGWAVYETKEMKIALCLVEALANIWDLSGPLKPAAQTDIAQNASTRFFDIVKDKNTSYTMACFAEIWFNDAREAIVKTILASYRKQRDQVKDWSIPRLNAYLRFDDEDDIIPWGEERNVIFEEADGMTYLSLEPGNEVTNLKKGKQYHSHPLVERKRGNHSLLDVLYSTVFEEGESENPEGDKEDEGLFVKDTTAKDAWPKHSDVQFNNQSGLPTDQSSSQNPAVSESVPPPVPESQPNPASLFERIGASNGFNGNFSAFTPTTSLSPSNSIAAEPTPVSIFTPKPASGQSSIFTKQPPNEASSFPKQPVNRSPAILTQPSLPKESPGGQSAPTFSFTPKPSALPAATSSPLAPTLISNGTAARAPPGTPKASFFLAKQPSQNPPQPSISGLSEPIAQSQLPPGQSSPLPGFSNTPPAPIPSQGSFANGTPQLQSNIPKDSLNTSRLEGFPAPQQKSPSFEPPPPPAFDPWAGLTDWFALGNEGILDQFTTYQVESILHEAASQYVEEENERAVKRAEKRANAEADHFRYKSLATKYGYFWREETRRRYLKRRGREARIARREMAESARAAKTARSANIVEDFRVSTTVRRKDSLESLLGATGILNGVHDTNHEIRAVVQHDQKSINKRQRSERSTNSHSSSTSKHKRGKSDNPLRRSLMSDPSYLQGGSRIHLLSNYEASQPQVSGVQTDYFRLKARGISTLHDGTALASSAARSILHTKRSFDGFRKPSTPRQSTDDSMPRSVPAKNTVRPDIRQPSDGQENEIEVLKARAKAIMSEDRKSGERKRTLDDDEEELFARAKRVREQMNEGEVWYRKELERGTASRSGS